MQDGVTLAIRFPESELGEAGRSAQGLRELILDSAPGVAVEIRKDDPRNMDFGATLIAVLGTPAILALARGIANWVARHGRAVEIEFDGDKATFRAEGTIDDNVVKIAETLSRRKQ